MSDISLDFLDDHSRLLVQKMLFHVVRYPDIHINRFQVTNDGGFKYHLGLVGANTPTGFPQGTALPTNIAPALRFHGIAEPDPSPGAPAESYRFTDAVLTWFSSGGNLTDHEFQERLGRSLYSRYPDSKPLPTADDLIAELALPADRVRRNLRILSDLGLLTSPGRIATESSPPPPQRYHLSAPKGVQWANGGFKPVGLDTSPTVNVSLRVEVQNVIHEARQADVPPQVLEQFEARLHRVEEELEKDDGDYQPVKDMVETANQSRELLWPAVAFLYRHWDKVQQLAESATRHIT